MYNIMQRSSLAVQDRGQWGGPCVICHDVLCHVMCHGDTGDMLCHVSLTCVTCCVVSHWHMLCVELCVADTCYMLCCVSLTRVMCRWLVCRWHVLRVVLCVIDMCDMLCCVSLTKVTCCVVSWWHHVTYLVLLLQQLHREQGVADVVWHGLWHLLRDPEFFILHVAHKLVDELDLLQLLPTTDQRLLDLQEPAPHRQELHTLYREFRHGVTYTVSWIQTGLHKLCHEFWRGYINCVMNFDGVT